MDMRRVVGLRRSPILHAILAALFALQTPLCVLACLSSHASPSSGMTSEGIGSEGMSSDRIASSGMASTGMASGATPSGQTSSGHEGMPCHEAPGDSSPCEPVDHSDDCGCGESIAVLIPSVDTLALGDVPQDAIAPQPRASRPNAPTPWIVPAFPQETDLPPPDLLLRKSTLLI